MHILSPPPILAALKCSPDPFHYLEDWDFSG